jgi:hypothetical protein
MVNTDSISCPGVTGGYRPGLVATSAYALVAFVLRRGLAHSMQMDQRVAFHAA